MVRLAVLKRSIQAGRSFVTGGRAATVEDLKRSIVGQALAPSFRPGSVFTPSQDIESFIVAWAGLSGYCRESIVKPVHQMPLYFPVPQALTSKPRPAGINRSC
jgi:hypothetical protein